MKAQLIVVRYLFAVLAIVMFVANFAIASDASDSAVRDKFVLKEEPKDAASVLDTREKAQDKDDVVVVGRIGGRTNPWVKGAAAFSIVDTSLKACNENPGDTCPTP